MTTYLPPELRETRLRVRVDELRYKADHATKTVNRLHKRLELKDAKIAALQREVRFLADQVDALERKLARQS